MGKLPPKVSASWAFFIMVAAIAFISIYTLNALVSISTFSNGLFFRDSNPPIILKTTKKAEDDLSTVLERASKGNNKTVIIAVVNQAYAESVDNGDSEVNMFDLFLESIWVGEGTRPLIKHIVIVAMDRTAYERCLFRGIPNCYLVPNNTPEYADFTKEEVFMSKGFRAMMWRRTFFLLNVLRKGYNFVFTDTDLIWLRNPFLRLNIDQVDDIKFSTDKFIGDSKSDLNPINTGFYYVKSNNKTVALFERWFSMHDKYPDKKDQDVLVMLVREQGVIPELGLNVTFLETRYFYGFCADVDPDPRHVVTIHATCCRYISVKGKVLEGILSDWKWFKRTENGTGDGFAWTSRVTCRNSRRH